MKTILASIASLLVASPAFALNEWKSVPASNVQYAPTGDLLYVVPANTANVSPGCTYQTQYIFRTNARAVLSIFLQANALGKSVLLYTSTCDSTGHPAPTYVQVTE